MSFASSFSLNKSVAMAFEDRLQTFDKDNFQIFFRQSEGSEMICRKAEGAAVSFEDVLHHGLCWLDSHSYCTGQRVVSECISGSFNTALSRPTVNQDDHRQLANKTCLKILFTTAFGAACTDSCKPIEKLLFFMIQLEKLSP